MDDFLGSAVDTFGDKADVLIALQVERMVGKSLVGRANAQATPALLSGYLNALVPLVTSVMETERFIPGRWASKRGAWVGRQAF